MVQIIKITIAQNEFLLLQLNTDIGLHFFATKIQEAAEGKHTEYLGKVFKQDDDDLEKYGIDKEQLQQAITTSEAASWNKSKTFLYAIK